MFRSPALLATLALIPLLSACGETGGGKVRSASAASTAKPSIRKPLRQPVVQPPPKPQVQMLPGLEGVIGSTAVQLSRQFGTARLDVLEGDARKLQYGGKACVLDIYLYPSAPGREPQATYVDARRPSDGQDVDRVSCIGALRRP